MKAFEFRIKRAGKHKGIGIHVNATSIEEAVEKANRFFDCDDAIHPVNHPSAKGVSLNVSPPVTARNIASIYGPLHDPACRDFTLTQWRQAYEIACSLCHLPCLQESAHLHQGKWICEERCWDDRLKASE